MSGSGHVIQPSLSLEEIKRLRRKLVPQTKGWPGDDRRSVTHPLDERERKVKS